MSAALQAFKDEPGNSGFVPMPPASFRLVDGVGNSDSVRSTLCLQGPFTNSPDFFGSVATRRARLAAGLEPWARCRPQYRLRIGGAALPFSALSDEALTALRAQVAGDVRRERARRQG